MLEPQTRRRGAALEQAILDGAWAELNERGWHGFTVEGVAARCETGKAAIYKRWSGRVPLALAVLNRARLGRQPAPELSGALRQDLVDYLTEVTEFLAGPFGEAVRGVLLEGRPADRERASSLARPASSRMAGIVGAARSRGELVGEPSEVALNVGDALATQEYLYTGVRATDAVIGRIVDEVWLPALQG